MAETKVALLAADTDRTQDYVFETSRLAEIRGASRMLDELNHRAAKLVMEFDARSEIIIDGGGSLLAIVPYREGKLQDLCSQIEAEYIQRTGIATITVDYRLITEKALLEGYPSTSQAPFGALMNWATTWLRRRKDGRNEIPWINTLPFAERCSSCHIRPADIEYSLPDRPLCSICNLKNEKSARFSWFNELAIDNQAWEPHDLSEIGQASKSRSGNIGYIYLDGDAMGKVFEQIDRQENARTLSITIENATKQAVKEALWSYSLTAKVKPSDGRKGTRFEPLKEDLDSQGYLSIYPFEILTIGGDDLILIVPADRAIPIACEISQNFQKFMQIGLEKSKLPKQVTNWPYTLSGGVVLSDDHNPVRVLHDLASELKSNAKRARQHAKAIEGYLDFVILTGADVPDRSLKRSRQLFPYLIEQPGFRPLSLLGRPYPVSRLYMAWRELQVAKQKGFPISQITTITENLLKGVQESKLFYKYQRERSIYFEYLDAAINALQGRPRTSVADPWEIFPGATKINARSVLWDLAELYSLVSE